MKKIILKSSWVLFLLLGVFSCQKDDEFLKENPQTFYTVDNIFSTSAQVDQVLVSIYSHLRDLWANPDEAVWLSNFRGKGTDMYDVPVIRRTNTFSDYGTINPIHDTFYQVYSTWYYVVSRANLALYAAELPQISWSSTAEKAYVVAQARFFRAMAYRNLAELFGGVPLVKEIYTEPRYDFTRNTRVEIYQFAIDEMEAVLNDLPVTTTAGGRLVKGAAQHNLAELYLALRYPVGCRWKCEWCPGCVYQIHQLCRCSDHRRNLFPDQCAVSAPVKAQHQFPSLFTRVALPLHRLIPCCRTPIIIGICSRKEM